MDQTNAGGVNPLQPQQPTQPAAPVMPGPVAAQPAQPPVDQLTTQPVVPKPMPEIPTPVNPVFNPSNAANAANAPGINGVAAGVGQMSATEAIMQPAPPPAPDPIEEELKAPLKPAAPVPGSIGSAVSVPADANPADIAGDSKSTPSVAFNDPAAMPEANAAQGGLPKKKMEKKTLIAIAIIAGMLVVALAVILFVVSRN